MIKNENTHTRISYRILFPERQEVYIEAEAENISYGGMLIRTGEKLKVGSLIEIDLKGEDEESEKLKLLGEVKWIKEVPGAEIFSAGIFYLLPTAGRMFELFKRKNLHYIEDIKKGVKP